MNLRLATALQFGSKLATVASQLVVTAILARILDARDFGLVAIVVVFTNLFFLLSDLGIGPAVVQFKKLSDRDIGALFVFSILLGIGLTTLFAALSYPIAAFYGEPDLIWICLVSGLVILFATFNMVPNGLLLRDLRFKSIALRTIVVSIVSGVSAVVLAMSGFGYWSLVVQSILTQAGIFVWNVVSRPVTNLNFQFRGPLRQIFKFSSFQLGAGLVNYFNRNLDNLLVGKVLGVGPVGVYDKAYKLSVFPLNMFSSVVGSALQPFMVRHEKDPSIMFTYWVRVSKILSLVGVYLSVVCFLCASEIIELFYGTNWSAAAPLFAVLSLSIWAQMLANPTSAFFQALARTDLGFWATVCNTGLTCLGIAVGLCTGSLFITSCAISCALTGHLAFHSIFLVKRGFGQPARRLTVFLPELFLAAVVLALGLGLHYLSMDWNVYLRLAVVGGGVTVIFVCGLLALGQMQWIVDALPTSLRHRLQGRHAASAFEQI